MLVALASGFLYWNLLSTLRVQDDQLIADHIRVFQGILKTNGLDVQELETELEEFSHREVAQVHVRILGPDGRVHAEAPGMEEILPVESFPATAASTLPGKGAEVVGLDGHAYRVISAGATILDAAGREVVVQAGLDLAHEKKLLERFRERTLMVLAVALFLCALGGYHLARMAIRPVELVSEAARRIRSTTLGERIQARDVPRELAELTLTLNEMLDRLESAFERLASFSASIAHELRTPVHNMRGEIEVTLGKARTTEEYRDTLGSALEECDRLARMISSLLFIARAEDPDARIARENVDISRELLALLELYGASASELDVTLTLAVDPDLRALVDPDLFRRAVGNLVENALAHTPAGGRIEIAAAIRDEALIVSVSDTGCGICEANLPFVMDRFFRVDRSRGRSTGAGLGLGLAIVKSILFLHGGSTSLESQVDRGTSVTLEFPSAPDEVTVS